LATLNKISPRQLERVAVRASQRAATILRKYYRSGAASVHKGAVNLLTKADVESQNIIVKTLQSAFPSHSILAEENEQGHKESLDGPIWVVDPLDGTTNFAHGFPVFAISIAFREHGEMKFALVHQPILHELFLAHRGRGATLNGKKIHVSRQDDFSKTLLATGFPYDRRTSPENNLDLFGYFELKALCVRRAGAAAVDLAYLACGRFDGFWEPKLAPWDIAAGMLLVEEAGGIVSDYRGAPLSDLWCNEIVAANNSAIHHELVEGIGAVRARRTS